jgi:phage-related protein
MRYPMPPHKNENTDTASNSPRIVKLYPAKAVGKDMGATPEREQSRFVTSLTLLSNNMEPACTVSPLKALGPNVYELKENGRPAWRCVYYTGVKGVIYVLYVAEKTTNGVDRQLMSTVEKRLKALIAAIKAGDE